MNDWEESQRSLRMLAIFIFWPAFFIFVLFIAVLLVKFF